MITKNYVRSERVASVVWALKSRLPPMKSFLPKNFNGHIRLSPTLLPHVDSGIAAQLKEYAQRGQSLESILERKNVVPQKTETSIQFTDDGFWCNIWEVIRGDFSGKGFEEMLIGKYDQAIHGTYGALSCYIISAEDHDSIMEVRKLKDEDLVKLLDYE